MSMKNASDTIGNRTTFRLVALARAPVNNSTCMVFTDKNLFQIIALFSFNNDVKVFAKCFS